MSLQIAAQHLASKGRGPDTMLVHMAPGEVKSLQQIAMANGGSLTINPQTGLPEAGFLSSILPMIAGFALGPAGFALMSAPMAGLTVGGLQALRTGSLSKGVMAGLGAYSGAGLGEAVMQSGLQAGAQPAINTAQEAAVEQAKQLGQGYAQAAAPEFVGPQMSPELFAEKAQGITGGFNAARDAALANQQAAYTSAGIGDKLGTLGKGIQNLGTESGRSAFMNQIGGTGGLLKTSAAALAPVLMAQPNVEAPKDTEQYRYAYNPNREMPPYRAGDVGEFQYFRPSYTRLAADGGIMNAMPVQRMSDANNAEMLALNRSQMYAKGGISHLGDYSDGGRLLKGPGDGVSDSIPATIANKRPARLADGEFVVPARIVSELGNGSTEAGARKLYAMMNRVQQRRAKTVGKGKVAVNSRADKLLPA